MEERFFYCYVFKQEIVTNMVPGEYCSYGETFKGPNTERRTEDPF